MDVEFLPSSPTRHRGRDLFSEGDQHRARANVLSVTPGSSRHYLKLPRGVPRLTAPRLTTQIRRSGTITQLVRPPPTRQRTPRARKLGHFRILQRQVIQIIPELRQRMKFRRVVG